MKAAVLLIVLLALAGTTIGLRRWRQQHHSTSANGVTLPAYDDAADDTRAPAGVRIKVEVLNATKSHGLARRATQYLRDRGFDVVLIGTTHLQQQETVVLDRSNHPEWTQLLAKTMHGRAASRPDTSHYLDATVLVGSDWTPPPLPFYP